MDTEVDYITEEEFLALRKKRRKTALKQLMREMRSGNPAKRSRARAEYVARINDGSL